MPNETVQQVVTDAIPNIDNALKAEALEWLKSLRHVAEVGVERAGDVAGKAV